MSIKHGKGLTTSRKKSNNLQVPEVKHTKRRERLSLANVITTCSNAFGISFLSHKLHEVPKVPPASTLLLPSLICEYKKRTALEMKAFNQTWSYLVSAVTFLKDQGLTEHPVYGLATDGSKGGVLMAWFSTETKVRSPGFYVVQVLLTNSAANLYYRARHRHVRRF